MINVTVFVVAVVRVGVGVVRVGDHFPIQISLDKPLKRNTPLAELRYRFGKANDDLLHNTMKGSLTSIVTNKAAHSHNDPKSPISQAILDLMKEKRRLRRLYNNTQDPNTKFTVNKLQTGIRTEHQESTIS